MEVTRSGLFSGKRGRVAATVFFPGKLETHYGDHGKEFFPAMSIEEYEARAKNFFAQEPTRTTEYFYDIDDILYRYDTKTNEFGMCTSSGAMITYFLPTNKLIYWYRQVEQYAI
jgi:pyocin large subunit-like protein